MYTVPHSVFHIMVNESLALVVQSYTTEPSLANVLCLLLLGLVGTVFNLGLLVASLVDLRHIGTLGLSAQVSSVFTHFATAGIIESTLNASLAAFYASGGFSNSSSMISGAGKAALLGSMLLTSTCYSWSVAGLLVAHTWPGTSLPRVRAGAAVAWTAGVALSVAVLVVLARNRNAISSTPLVPRVKIVTIHQALRYSLTTICFALAWLISVIVAAVAGKRFVTSPVRQTLMSGNAPSPSLALAVIVLLYLLLRVPADLAGLVPGARPATLHAVLTWFRFFFSSASPLAALTSAGKLRATLAAMLHCSSRSSSVSPPATSLALIRQVTQMQVQANSLALVTPIIFPTPGGLFLRVSRTLAAPASPAFTYRACDVMTLLDRSDYKRDHLERRDVFIRDSRFLRP